MKTRDLMRGDKVYETLLDDTPQVVTVEEVGQNHIYIGMEDDDMALLRYEPEHLGWNIKHIEPIPLTKEMLEANGFQYGSHEYTYWPDEDGEEAPFHILQSSRYGLRINVPYRVVTLQYVHQLQHVLRLCGLNGLADNFKVN